MHSILWGARLKNDAYEPPRVETLPDRSDPPAFLRVGTTLGSIGLLLLGLGFAALSYGSSSIPQGAKTASVSMIWLVLAYLLHTMGELSLSPVGLSYVSKLVPPKKIGVMFGVWYLAIAAGNYLAQFVGSYIDVIVEKYSMSTFFLIFTLVPAAAGVILLVLNPLMKKMMHGIK